MEEAKWRAQGHTAKSWLELKPPDFWSSAYCHPEGSQTFWCQDPFTLSEITEDPQRALVYVV